MTGGGFDQVRFDVPADVVRAFADHADPDDPALVARLRDLLAPLATAHLDGLPGFFVLAGLAGFDEAVARRFTVAASTAVGSLLPQDAAGALLRDVRDRGMRLGEGRTGRYSDSRDGGSLHTDGPHAPFAAPECFALFCVRQSTRGGELLLVHVDDLLAGLDAETIAELGKDFHFDRRSAVDDAPTVAYPVLANGPAGATVRYLREYINLGHAHPEVPDLTPDQVAALDALDARLDDTRLQQAGKLRPGEMIFVNNLVLCHGRTAFEDDAEGGRLMLRTWIRRAPAIP